MRYEPPKPTPQELSRQIGHVWTSYHRKGRQYDGFTPKVYCSDGTVYESIYAMAKALKIPEKKCHKIIYNCVIYKGKGYSNFPIQRWCNMLVEDVEPHKASKITTYSNATGNSICRKTLCQSHATKSKK